MDFAAFHAAYEALVEKARTNRLMPDDFAGATMSLTNPGGLGTVASVPRLMAGQGSIIAVGAIGYPAEFSAVPEERLREFGISKVMTVTSTYDHRVIQGAESGAFLAHGGPPAPGRPGLLRAHRREPAASGRPSYQLARPNAGRQAGAGGRRPGRAGDALPRGRGDGAGEGLPHARPPGRAPRSARHAADRRSGPQPRPARPHTRGDGGDSVEGAPHRRARRHARRVAAVPPGHLLRHDGLRDRAHLDPRGARLAPREDRERRLPPADDARRAAEAAPAAHRGRDAREVPAQGLSRPEAVLDRRRGHAGADARPHDRARGRERRARRGDRHGAPRAAQRAGPYGRAGRTRRSSPSSRAAATSKRGSSRPRAAPAT